MRPSQRSTVVPGGTSTISAFAVGAVHQRAHAVAAAFGLVAPAAPEGLQVAQRVVAAQHDVAAAAAVAAVGPALGHARLAPEGQRPVAAPSGLDLDPCAIGQHGPG